jgi:hypothetical protein
MSGTKCPKASRDLMEDLPRSGRPSTSVAEVHIAKVEEIVTENPHSILNSRRTFCISRVSTREICVTQMISYHLSIQHVAARLVPKDLSFFQKLNRSIAEDMLNRVISDPTFMKRIVSDEMRRGFLSITCKLVNKLRSGGFQLNQNKKKRRQSRSKVKVMFVFYDYRGVMHSEFLLGGQTVNKE